MGYCKLRINTLFIIPVRNDYESVKNLLKEFSNLLGLDASIKAKFILVDDGSSNIDSRVTTIRNIDIEIIETKYKIGHQKAIHFGLNFAHDKFKNKNVVILDGDGEDKPQDAINIARLLFENDQSQVILARRLTRKTRISFKINYFIFRLIFKSLTGVDLRSGNFMGIKSGYLEILKSFPSLKSHIAGSVIRYCPNIKYLDLNRGYRIAGKSQMNFSRLALHAYGAFSVFADILITRITIFLVSVSIVLSTLGIFLLFLKFIGYGGIIPGWTSIILFQIASTSILLSSFALLSLFLFMKDDK